MTIEIGLFCNGGFWLAIGVAGWLLELDRRAGVTFGRIEGRHHV